MICLPAGAGTVRPASGGPPSSTTWDAAAKGANIVLSDGNLSAEGGLAEWQSVYASEGKSSGKWQFEIVIVGAVGVLRAFAALADKTNLANLLNTYTGNPGATVKESLGYWGNGTFYRNLTAGATNSAVTATAAGDVITVALDADTATAYWYRNGTLARTEALPAGKTWYPAASVNGGGSKVTLRTTGLTYPQSGFADWA